MNDNLKKLDQILQKILLQAAQLRVQLESGIVSATTSKEEAISALDSDIESLKKEFKELCANQDDEVEESEKQEQLESFEAKLEFENKLIIQERLQQSSKIC